MSTMKPSDTLDSIRGGNESNQAELIQCPIEGCSRVATEAKTIKIHCAHSKGNHENKRLGENLRIVPDVEPGEVIPAWETNW